MFIDQEIRSMPIDVSPSSGYGADALSHRATRRTISSTVLHATCRNQDTVFWLSAVSSHALRPEILGEPRNGLHPWRGGYDHAAAGTLHARHDGDQVDPTVAEVLMTPTAHPPPRS